MAAHHTPCRRCECAGDKGRLLDDLLLDLAAAGEAGQGISGELPCCLPGCNAAPLLCFSLCCLAPHCPLRTHTKYSPSARLTLALAVLHI